MTREIKFRGRNILNNDWVYGDLIHNDEYCHVYVYPRDAGPLGLEHRVDPETIGQFTGLKDIHGNDIYEGDIIRHMWNATVGRGKNKHEELQPVSNSKPRVISFRMGAFGYVNQKETKYMEEEWLPLLDWECEVIGNIHDNPELLKQE